MSHKVTQEVIAAIGPEEYKRQTDMISTLAEVMQSDVRALWPKWAALANEHCVAGPAITFAALMIGNGAAELIKPSAGFDKEQFLKLCGFVYDKTVEGLEEVKRPN